jgi:hypothetical protein
MSVVVAGRLSMKKAIFAIAAVAGLSFLILNGCGSSTTPPPPPQQAGNGSVVVMATDAPLCNVFSFTVTISGITLTPQGGGDPVSVLGQGQSVTIDFLRLMDFNTVLNLASVPAGTYSQMALTLSSAQLTVIDVTQSPPVPVPITTSLENATVTMNLDPAVTVTEGGTVSLLIDFHLFRSVRTDGLGDVTGMVNPQMSVARVSPTPQDGLGRLDELHGVVQSVSTTSSNSSFVGSFRLQTRGGFGPVLTVQVTSTTEFEDISGLSELAVNSFVEVEAFVDTAGNIVAREVEVEGSIEGEGRAAFEGLVLHVERDLASGKAKQFVLFVRAEHPDVSGSIPLRSALTVNVSDTTRFGVIRPGINEAGLTFDATNLGVGQAVIALGAYQTDPQRTLDAHGVALRPQALRGQFSPPALGISQNDPRVGGFNLVPCSALFKGQPVHVFTFANTEFYGISDLNGLSSLPPIHAKGLLFYEPGLVTINGITVTPPSMVMEARRVHQRAIGD